MMKKILLGILVMLALVSCGETEPTVMYMGLTEEDQMLFKSEVGLNDQLYLGEYLQAYKINFETPIDVSKLDGSYDEPMDIDLILTSGHIASRRSDLNASVIEYSAEKMLSSESTPFIKVTTFDLGSDRTLLYAYLEDEQRGFAGCPIQTSTYMPMVAASVSEGSQEVDMHTVYHLMLLAQGQYPWCFASFVHELSNGTKVHVLFEATK